MNTAMLGGAMLIAVATGCGGSGVVPVDARVSLDGQPLADASVSFVRVDGEQGRAAFGMTDAEGVAKLTTFDPFDGALPGSYAVVILKAPEDAMTFEETPVADDAESLLKHSASRGAAPPTRRKRVRTVIPEVYAAKGTTPLRCEVSPGMAPPVFELSSN